MNSDNSKGERLNTMRQSTPSSDVMRISVLSLAMMLAVSGWSQTTSQPAVSKAPTVQHFDGKWWSKTTADEHSGFINGAADCLTWTAHQKGFNATPEQLVGKITKFYKEHPESTSLSVIEVWRQIWSKTTPSTAAAQPGETWKSAHWYLDGFWWLDETQEQKQGFIEGYLWCMRTCVPNSEDRYSRSASFYVDKIDAFARANSNSKAGREKVASILRRYRDKTPPATPK